MSDKFASDLIRNFNKSLLSRFYTKTPEAPANGPEHIDNRELARRWNVSKRWVDDQTRTEDDPIPHFRRGRIVRYLWNAGDTSNALNLWWFRHTTASSRAHHPRK